MAINSVNNQTKFLEWKEITNEIISAIGDNNSLTTDVKNTLVNAINEVDAHNDDNLAVITDILADIGDITNLTTTVTTNIVQAINGLQGEVTTNAGNISTNATDIGTNSDDIGVIGDLNTTATNLTDAVNEVDSKINPSGSNPYYENFDNGRFSLDSGVTASAWNKGSIFNVHNSSAFASGDKFINDNSDNGGSNGNMGGDALALLAKLVSNGRSEQRYGYEFFISKLTAGGGTGNVINFNSTNYYPQTNTGDMYLGAIGESITWSGYVKNNDVSFDILLGDTNPNITTYIDGALQGSPYELANATGWVHFRQKLLLTQEFKSIFPLISATTGNSSVTQIALSTLYRADVPDIQLGVVK